jgi:hypothetical protein
MAKDVRRARKSVRRQLGFDIRRDARPQRFAPATYGESLLVAEREARRGAHGVRSMAADLDVGGFEKRFPGIPEVRMV